MIRRVGSTLGPRRSKVARRRTVDRRRAVASHLAGALRGSLVLGGLLLVSAAAPLRAQTAPAGTASMLAPGGAAPMLAPGDMVRIEVWRRPELSGEFTILGTGAIGHPLYKEISVTGISIGTAEGRIDAFLRTLEANPQFVFEPLLRVAVVGEVRAPDLYHLPPETTLAEAVARAGGLTERGKSNDVRLFRDGRERRLDLRDPAGATVRLLVRSGDEIVVQRRGSFNFLQHVFVPLTSAGALVFSIIRVSNE